MNYIARNVIYFKGMLTMPSISLRIPEEIEQQLNQLADSTGRTKSWIANQAIQDYLTKELWQINEIKTAITQADAGTFASEKEVKDTFTKWGIDAN